MDLNTAINLGNKYKDYTDTETRDRDLNQTVVNRVFDVGPLSTYNVHNLGNCPAPNSYVPKYTQAEQCVQHNDNPSQMSREYLQMKHAQEYESLMENPSVNTVAIDRLKQQQFDETRMLANQVQMNHANKYKNLKYMSPEMLNRVYGRQPCHSVLPTPTQTGSNDVYEQTSYGQTPFADVSRQLKQDLVMRQQQILSQKGRQGIQSYKSGQFGTNLDEAYTGL
jgi:hypothetical protein